LKEGPVAATGKGDRDVAFVHSPRLGRSRVG
jgi:hypothetical protein